MGERTGAAESLGRELVAAVESGDAGKLSSVLTQAMGYSRHQSVGSARPQVVIYKYRCPYCDPEGQFNRGGSWGRMADGGKCLDCLGRGVLTADEIRDPSVFAPGELKEVGRPPAVMKSPCVDCAYRPESPESDTHADMLGVPIRPDAGAPFFCHHGLIRQGGGYEPQAYYGLVPLGAMVCAGWWALATGEALPEVPFRDPGGACRRESAPEVGS